MAKRKTGAAAVEQASRWRNRIIGEGAEDPERLLANPKNFRIHPQAQQDALAAVLDNVGWVQHAAIVNQRTGFVVDGHLRVSLALSRGERSVPVTFVDLSDAEEALILASLDAISAAAVTDQDKLHELLGGIDVAAVALDNLFAGMLEEASKTSLGDAAGGSEPDERSSSSSSNRALDDTKAQIKPVLYAEQVAVFERAIRATGEMNRGKALIEVCRYYLESNGERKQAAGQLDAAVENVAAN
jgi:hypothetical protein